MNEQSKALDMIKSVYEDNSAEINGREYVFTSFNHKQRRKVFAYYTQIASQLEKGNMSFLDSKEFEHIEKLIEGKVMYDGNLLSVLNKSDQENHWNNFGEDYIIFVTTAISVISYPFLKGSITS
tara:strand:+ start:412 stop:783 length:372 start_codon:yes stop_codon:yes gene_type:complete